MAKPRLLLVGADQCSWQDWKAAECAALYEPYGYDTAGLDEEVLPSPSFDASRFDGVVFAIPNYKKALVPLIVQALQAGLPALIFKLRVCSSADMDPIRALPKEQRGRLWVGEHYQYLPGAMAARQAIADGMIGKVEYVSLRCTLPMEERAPWMDAYGHLIFEDLAYHHMTVVYSLCGPLAGQVYAKSWSPSWLDHRDRAYSAFLLEADAGWHMTYDTRWGAAGAGSNFFGELTVEGSKGQVWTDGEKAVFTARNRSSMELPAPLCPYDGWAGIVDHFGDALSGQAQPMQPELLPFDRFDGILKMLYSAVASAEQGRQISY